ncbi:MAG: hypothetical protein JO142_04015 [Burkholderiales bacterium]|nr:hypothetical protein [Burkholderiales bacterium]
MTTSRDLQHTPALPAISVTSTRLAGAGIVISSILSIVFVALDPMASGHDPQAILQSMVNNQAIHQLIHVVAMLCVLVQWYGYTVLSQRLSLQRPTVRMAYLSFALGSVLMFIATIIDGFISTDTAAVFLKGSPEAIKFGYWAVQTIEGVVLTDIARVAWVLQSIAAVAWSFALLRQAGVQRVIGSIGLLAGALPAAAVILAGSNMTVAVVVGILLVQALWNISAGVLLLMFDRAGKPADVRNTQAAYS